MSKAKYEGLLYVPAGDHNFISGIQSLSDLQLDSMLKKLYVLNEEEGGHRGRIKAVEKEINNRNGNSTDVVAMNKMQNEIDIAERLYSDNMPYELDRIENEIRFYQEQAGQSLIEMGKRFIRIKAHENHGMFIKTIESVGMTPRSVQFAMLAAKKFSNTITGSHLNTSKLKVLTVLDEKEIETLDVGGEFAGVTLDEIDQMTTRELREAIRKERKKHQHDVDTREKVIKQKEEKINELDQQIRYQQPPTKEQIAVTELDKLNDDYIHTLTAAMDALRKGVNILNRAQCVPDVDEPILNEWINKYDKLMPLVTGVYEEFIDTIDNLQPIVKGSYKDGEAQ